MRSPATAVSPQTSISRSEAIHTLTASFLGWTLDAFDFFVLVFVVPTIASEYKRPIRDVVFTITLTLAIRTLGAAVFGWLADRYGRRLPLMADVIFYSAVEFLSGLAPNYHVFLVLRALYGIGMGGEWGGGAALARLLVGPSPGRLRGGIPARGRRLLLRVSALRMEGAVFRGRAARAPYHLYPLQGPGIGGMAAHASHRARRGPHHTLEPRFARLPGPADDDDELRVARHAGPISDVS